MTASQNTAAIKAKTPCHCRKFRRMKRRRNLYPWSKWFISAPVVKNCYCCTFPCHFSVGAFIAP